MNVSKPTYFAAANGYHGFISYFDRVFPPEAFTTLFVLKGGPGTGKSSLMRRLSDYFLKNDFNVEEILCSSDPSSLDGVIAEKNNLRYAIIDGTAPHERDAMLPGAFDEIINLGDNWDERWLSAKRGEILNLVNEKKNAYKTAYNYLKIAGSCADVIGREEEGHFNKFKAKSKADHILSDIISSESGKIGTRLLSSFGRHGKYDIKPYTGIYDAKITVDKNAYLFLNVCREILLDHHTDITLFPNAIDKNKLDAILLNGTKVLIQIADNAEIVADEFITLAALSKERIRVAKEMREEMLLESARWFKIAAEIHSSLEDIYSSAMDFAGNDELFAKIISKISSYDEKG